MVLRIALRNLLQAKRRSMFLGVALGAVTLLLVLLLGLSNGLTDTMMRSATTLSSGHVNVSGFYKAKSNDANPVVLDTPAIRKIVEESVPDLDFVIDRARGWARIIGPDASLNAGLTGIDIKEEQRLLRILELAKESEYVEGGRDQIIGGLDGLEDPKAIVVFAAQAERMGVKVGDLLTVSVETMRGMRNTTELRIVAVAKDIGFMSNYSAFVTKPAIRELYRYGEDVSGAVQIYLKDVESAPKVMDSLRRILADKGYELMEHDPRAFFMKFDVVSGEDWTGQRLDLTLWRDEISFLTWVLDAVDSVSFILVAILVGIIGVGIMNSMWMAVRERTREVGTLRAIGMSRANVLFMFLAEAAILGVIGTGIGGILGGLLVVGVDALEIRIPVQAVRAILMSDRLHLVIEPMQILVAVGVFSMVAALSALMPAYRASRLQPITALGHVS